MEFLFVVFLALLFSVSMPAAYNGSPATLVADQGTDQDTDQGTNKTTESLTKLEEAVNGKIKAALDQVNKFFIKPNPEQPSGVQKRSQSRRRWRTFGMIAVGVLKFIGREVTNADAEVTPSSDPTFQTPQDVALTKQALNILWTAVTAMEAKVNQSANQKS